MLGLAGVSLLAVSRELAITGLPPNGSGKLVEYLALIGVGGVVPLDEAPEGWAGIFRGDVGT